METLFLKKHQLDRFNQHIKNANIGKVRVPIQEFNGPNEY
jgi:hypothetical protein